MQRNKQQQLARMERSESGKYATQHLRRIASYLDRAFRYQKAGFKPKYQAHIRCLHREIKLRRSDPATRPIVLPRFRSNQREKKLYTLIPTALQRAEREQDARRGL